MQPWAVTCAHFGAATAARIAALTFGSVRSQLRTPVFSVIDDQNPWVDANPKETDITYLRIGQTASLSVDSFPDQPFTGKVTFVADRAEFTPKNIQTPDERVKLVYRVKVEVATRNEALKPGMPADAVLPLDQSVATAAAR